MAFLFVFNKSKRKALSQLYAFCRLADDIADEQKISLATRKQLLSDLKQWIQLRNTIGHPFWDSFLVTRLHFCIPDVALLGILEGVEMDMAEGVLTIDSWNQLDRYCFGVAGCVGFATLSILEANGPMAKTYAELMGRALQYLNIMRDIDEDKKANRIYIPIDYLRILGIPEGHFPAPHFLNEIRTELFRRAKTFYDSTRPYSWACFPAEIMAAIYWYGSKKYWLYGNSSRLTKMEKLRAAFLAFYRF